MRITLQEVLIAVAVASCLWLAFIVIPGSRFDASYANADHFCRSVKAGASRADVISLANQTAATHTLLIERELVHLNFGDGCGCTIHFEKERAMPSAGMCQD